MGKILNKSLKKPSKQKRKKGSANKRKMAHKLPLTLEFKDLYHLYRVPDLIQKDVDEITGFFRHPKV